MTLRHRLLLVYSIVVLLSVVTVGVAVLELRHSRQIFSDVQHWYGIVLTVQKLKSGFPGPPSDSPDEPSEFSSLLAGARLNLSDASQYVDVGPVRETLYEVYQGYRRWQPLEPGERADLEEAVRRSIDHAAELVEHELGKLNAEAGRQNSRTNVLLLAVMGMTALHVTFIGWLLRRWLLRPMEQLNRQVEALARDEPPGEPLLESPREMASLAQALDRAWRSLRHMREQLIDAERLTTIGQFAAQLAHNLRNPLASIRATAQLMARRNCGDDYVRQRTTEIVESVDRLNRWIEGLMEIARRQPTPTRSADVTPILHRVRDALAGELAAKELTLTVEAPSEGLACPHDPDTLEHALIAMVVNAIEASPLSASIEISAGYRQADGRGRVCRIAVHDQGDGLPPEHPERIFEFSYSTKQRGMGLGLALARQALQRQGGIAGAENNPEGGATVYVELPLEGTNG